MHTPDSGPEAPRLILLGTMGGPYPSKARSYPAQVLVIDGAAGVKTLVLSHLVPGDPDVVTDAVWLEGAQANFHGEVIVGTDLLEI